MGCLGSPIRHSPGVSQDSWAFLHVVSQPLAGSPRLFSTAAGQGVQKQGWELQNFLRPDLENHVMSHYSGPRKTRPGPDSRGEEKASTSQCKGMWTQGGVETVTIFCFNHTISPTLRSLIHSFFTLEYPLCPQHLPDMETEVTLSSQGLSKLIGKQMTNQYMPQSYKE